MTTLVLDDLNDRLRQQLGLAGPAPDSNHQVWSGGNAANGQDRSRGFNGPPGEKKDPFRDPEQQPDTGNPAPARPGGLPEWPLDSPSRP